MLKQWVALVLIESMHNLRLGEVQNGQITGYVGYGPCCGGYGDYYKVIIPLFLLSTNSN